MKAQIGLLFLASVTLTACGSKDTEKTTKPLKDEREQVCTGAQGETCQTLQHDERLPYSDKEKAAVEKVFNDFGPLYVGPTESQEVRIKGEMPWTGYWYPKRKDDLFRDEISPLAKLDNAARRSGIEIKSADWERNVYSPNDPEWTGLCDAWALASIQAPEPKTALRYQDVRFSISDQKALLVKKFEGSLPLVYGNRYFGTYESDGDIQDLRPEAFQRIVEVVIGERGLPIVVDDDPGPEVWSKPMYRMRWVVKQDPDNENAYLVTAYPLLVKSRNDVSDTLTQPQDMKAPVYEYRLFVDKNDEKDGKYRVIYGEWIGVSLSEHPDMVFLPNPDPSAIRPINPEIAKAISVIDRIFSQGEAEP